MTSDNTDLNSELSSAQEDFKLELELEHWREIRDQRKREKGMGMCEGCCQWFDEEDLFVVKATDDCEAVGIDKLVICNDCKESMEDRD
jgi:hypothetical protein